jgi:hypothetical protein
MRISTKILITTFVLIAVSLIIYDLALKAEYLKGNYTDPYSEYVPIEYKDFNEVQLDASTAVNIVLVKGPYKVLVHPAGMDFVKITQTNGRLFVRAAFSDHYRSINANYILYVSCPTLTSFTADAQYTAGSNQVTDTSANEFNWKPTLISGFTVDSMEIRESHAANVILENNKIEKLNATVGIDDRSCSNFTIGENNLFRKANLSILNKSRLWVKSPNHNDVTYHLADSATLLVNGVTVKRLLKL